MNKSESLILLDQLGLNTIDYFITKDVGEAKKYLDRFPNGRRSMRTERGDEFLCPFYYWTPAEELLPKATQHIEEGYKLIFSNSLDWKESIAFGSVALTDSVHDHIDIVFGPGLCRDLESHPNKLSLEVPLSIVPFSESDSRLESPQQARILNTVYRLVRSKCLNYAPCVVEFSRYPYKVGKLNKEFIMWELRNYV